MNRRGNLGLGKAWVRYFLARLAEGPPPATGDECKPLAHSPVVCDKGTWGCQRHPVGWRSSK